MTAKGEVVPAHLAKAWGQGRAPDFIFPEILPPEASVRGHRGKARMSCAAGHSDLPINSFMISLVPP